MTYIELEQKIGTQNQSDWRQAKGGGWLHKTAIVEHEEYITENAIVFANTSGFSQVSGNARVYGDAWVYGNARVSGNAQVYGDAWVSGNARVYGDARVYGNAQVSGNAQVYGDAWVSGNARVYGNAQVYGDAWVKSPLFIIGSRYSLTNSKHGHIQIGCECHTFAWWKENGKKLAEVQNFSPEEIIEYEAYVDLFIKIGK